MKCWFWHDWEKWCKPYSVGVVGEPNREAIVQARVCARCGKYQRKHRPDRG